MLASQSQHRRFVIPGDTMVALAIAAKLASDEQLRLIEVVGQVADKLDDSNVLRWLTPNLLACSERVSRIEQILSAIVQEHPSPSKEQPNG